MTKCKEKRVAKAEWGTKRTCPDCGERFYDLGNDDPAVCIACDHNWVPEPILKTKQPIPLEKEETEEQTDETDEDEDNDIDIDDENVLSLDDDEDEDVSEIVDTSLADKDED